MVYVVIDRRVGKIGGTHKYIEGGSFPFKGAVRFTNWWLTVHGFRSLFIYSLVHKAYYVNASE